jgi:hypothetical protein
MGARKTVPPLYSVNSAPLCRLRLRLQVVSDGAVWRQPHLLQLEFLHTLLIGRDGRAFDAHRVLFDGLGRINRDLVIRLVSVGQAQVVVLEVDVEVRVNELSP